ncbi:hypothetical protein SPRG_06209 [Saprolegnia parasitica CBS 223.65]|uniref:Uncharacterized protein n=1 Tax=Saprolegnia parasitica (strain CBS 223.65) TaxID=695850 RepID=A0A067CMY3_SAPPC|nr:hypothetical protein SPRG_06209 [Saprolegnia parasitica CBS 223.65]KDO28162.1 hypothetical protein SPRG_06209 [Saprolegnia parasitica CBS 223.65]|eukprot:XP_012200989.1 hypothetical protein SPRG_06209 [Saprolegnia parasitica CBS 223.65]
MTDANRDVLFLRVRTLEKYKHNYELLCSQLSDLNTQVGLQLQRHEMDVAGLQAIIRGLEKDKTDAATKVMDLEARIAAQATVMSQDKEYTDRIHAQLTTAAELLKASERNASEREKECHAQLDAMHRQLEKEACEHDVVKRELSALKLAKDSGSESSKDNKKLRRRLSEAHHCIETLRRQLMDECRRRDAESDAAQEAAQRRIAQLQQDAICLSEIASSSKAHAQSLEQQLDALEAQHRKSQVREEDLRRELERHDVHRTHDNDRLVLELTEKDTRIKALEKKVRELKIRWKQDREHLKAKLQRHEATDDEAYQLRQQVRELETRLVVADKRCRLLEREVSALRDVVDEAALRQERRDSTSRYRGTSPQ